MKRFRCTVTRTDEYIIEFDETKFNEEWMKGFREVFYNYHSLEEHAEHIAVNRVSNGRDFIEGYGIPKQNGNRPFSLLFEENEKCFEPGINIIIKSEDDDYDVDVEEIEQD